MQLIQIMLGLLFAMLTAALPPGKAESVATSVSPSIEARQLLQDGWLFSCCANCDGRYEYDVFWHIFDDLCGWLGSGQTLWTTQAYFTHDWYCGSGHWNPEVCVYLQIQYLYCGGDYEAPVSPANPAGAVRVDYDGCMGYFQSTIEPFGVCDGPPYSGGRLKTSDNCWVFNVVGSIDKKKSNVGVSPGDRHIVRPDCAPDARLCPVQTDANGTLLHGPSAVVNAKFGSVVEKLKLK